MHARSLTVMVLVIAEESVMAVPLATRQQCSASTLPSADREGNPLASMKR